VPFETGRRLSLLVEAGRARFAIEATSVLEVAPVEGKALQGVEVADLSRLLGGPAEGQPQAAVILDVSPTLAVRVRKVIEVADVAQAPLLKLPALLGETLSVVLRGALVHQGLAFLELACDALPHQPGALFASVPRPVYLLEEIPDRALLFESQGRCYGIPLGWVSQVVGLGEAYCPLPAPGTALGVLPQAKALWPVYSPAGLLGGEGKEEPLVLLAELGGHNAAITASRVLGVFGRLKPTDIPGELSAEGAPSVALFLDLQRMFS
jgi:chemotaxis signal transduction protein